MISIPLKDKQSIIPINEVITGKSLLGGKGGGGGGGLVKKLVLSQNKRPYNLETFECNHKKLGTESETSLLINCGKLSSLPSKKWRSS